MQQATKIYLDTSVISALFDDRTPERQALTYTALKTFSVYDVYISDLVIEELSAASLELVSKYQQAISGFKILSLTDEVYHLAGEYLSKGIFPEKYYDDALHVALSSVNGIPYLLSWNFKHMVKVKTRQLVSIVNTLNNYYPLEIIAPPEL